MEAVSFFHVSLLYIRVFVIVFLGQIPNESEPANAVVTFDLTLREYVHERTINIYLTLHAYCVKVRVAFTNSVIE